MFVCLFSNYSSGQVNISTVNTFVTTSLDGWNGTLPIGFTRTGANYVGTSASTTGGVYAIANSGFGYQPSGTSPATSATLTGTFQNTTGVTQTSVTIEYDAFNIVSRSSRTPNWAVTSSLGSVTSLNWTYNASSTNTSPDVKTVTLTGLSIANNASFTVTWASDRGLGLLSSPLIGLRNVKVKFNQLVVSCTTPTSLTFQTQATNVLQGNAMSPAVTVAAICADGTVATSFTGNVTITVNSPGCGYTSQTVACVNGVATFSSIIFTRSPQSNLTLTATSSGLTSATSSSFNVTAPAGAPTTTIIAQNDFDANQSWTYSASGSSSFGSGGSSGSGVVSAVSESGTNVLRKYHSVDNASGESGSQVTVTFANQTGLSACTNLDFYFNVLSFGSGSGSGNDTGDDCWFEVSTDGGTTWTQILYEYGYSDRSFPQSSSPVTSLNLSSTTFIPTIYNGPNDPKSAFRLSLSGISQFQFRFTAKNNRIQENWAVDNLKLTCTTYGSGIPFGLPIVDVGSDFGLCSGFTGQLNANVSSYVAPLIYSWSPATNLSSTSISNPITSLNAGYQTYTLTVTDNENCQGTDAVGVSIYSQPQIIFLSPP